MYKTPYQFCLSILIMFSIFLVACSGTEEPAYRIIAEPSLTAGEPIPEPTEDIILTVSGDIGMHNQDDAIVMDIPTIESAGLVEYTVFDPFEEEEIRYTGVLMSDLLDLWRVGEGATTLKMTALNDYQVEVPIDMLREFPVIFAMQSDGVYMPVANKGPAMLVLPYDDYEFERPFSNQYWIWQIKSIHVQ